MVTTNELVGVPDLADAETFKTHVPYEAWDELRALVGLPWQPAETGTLTDGFWVVSQYDRAAEVLQDADRFVSSFGAMYPLPNPTRSEPLNKHILFMDPPDHSRLRRTVTKAFAPRVVANFESWVREVVVDTLDAALPRERFDWIHDVTEVIPPLVIAQILGVPREERQRIVTFSRDIFIAQAMKDGGVTLGNVMMQLGDFLTQLGAEKLQNPADDMSTLLAQLHRDGELDDVEYVLYLATLLNAGAETTNTAMAHIGHLLATDPEIRDLTARALDEGRSAEVVDEFLRIITPGMNFARVASRDTELNGQAIKEGETVVLSFAAANRDPAAFSHPNTFDPFRTDPNPVAGTGGAGLAFGAGPHRCPAHVLAKLELRLLLEELHARKVVITMDGDLERGASGVVNQLLTLPVHVSMG